MAVHDDSLLGGESTRNLETVRRLRLLGAAGGNPARVDPAPARDPPFPVRRSGRRPTPSLQTGRRQASA